MTQPIPTSRRSDPGRYVCRWRPLSATVVLTSVALAGGGYCVIAGRSTGWIVGYMLLNAMLGLMLTLVATAWGAMIALTESARCGALFVILPPYMFYYAATRWKWMSQPSVLFLCGMGLVTAALILGRQQLALSAGSL